MLTAIIVYLPNLERDQTSNLTILVRFQNKHISILITFCFKQGGAEEARRAHNPKVDRSKLSPAKPHLSSVGRAWDCSG